METENRILIVDDDKVIVRILSAYLREEGYEVYEASNCAYALELVHNQNPSLIILDIELPDISGIDFCRILRNDTVSAFTPIIMLTSRNTTADKVMGLEAGADDYLTKPFELVELAARIKSHLRRARQERAFNPLTGLPGNKLIQEKLSVLLERK
ncbi:MAG: response regulator, partial [Clostridia bacterium]|nr:response regulator [Clostridia bacterium]